MAILDEIQRFWDDDASTYDDAPGHHPTSPAEQAAWTAALEALLPPAPATVLDCGAGTGFLSLIAARLGHRVTALDLSLEMLAKLTAAAVAEDLDITVVMGPAHEPPPGPAGPDDGAGFDVVIERHLLWTLPDPAAALAAWRAVAPVGRLVLVEGSWGETGGIEGIRASARQLVKRVRPPQPDHHDHYSDRVISALPHSGGLSPAQAVALVEASPWGPARVER